MVQQIRILHHCDKSNPLKRHNCFITQHRRRRLATHCHEESLLVVKKKGATVEKGEEENCEQAQQERKTVEMVSSARP